MSRQGYRGLPLRWVVLAAMCALPCIGAHASSPWLPEVRPKWNSGEGDAGGFAALTIRKKYELDRVGDNTWLSLKAELDATVALADAKRNREPMLGRFEGSHAWFAGPLSIELLSHVRYEANQAFDNQEAGLGAGLVTLGSFEPDSPGAALAYYLLPDATLLAESVWTLASADREEVGLSGKDRFVQASLELKWANYLDLIHLPQVRYEVTWARVYEFGTAQAWRDAGNGNYSKFRVELMYDFSERIAWCDGIFVAYRKGPTATDRRDEARFDVGIRFFGDHGKK
ncbi:MAG: hypothetical protein U1E27_14345 [Kiritimatiellia bacterium]|nr:hypothetical protein [Kiritimatiellia bacterium]